MRRLETQVLHRYGDDWNAYNYVWNDEQTDALLQSNVATDRELTIIDPKLPGGKRTQTWHHASRDECLLCHIWSAGTIHGFKLSQLKRPGPRGDDQLDRLKDMGIFATSLPQVQAVVSPHTPSC